MADLNVLNTSADLTGKTLVTAEGDRTVTGLWTFNRGAGAPPIAVAAGAGAVANFDADLLDGVQGADYSRAPNVLTTVAVGAQHNLAPGVLRNGVNILRCNNATALTLSGIDGGAEGMVLVVLSIGAGQVHFAHEDANSDAENRFRNFATVGQTSLAAGVGVASFYYDGTTQRWRLLRHEQGDWITRTYNAGDFTGGSGMTWTVEAGDLYASEYWLAGRRLTWRLWVFQSSVGGTLSNNLRAAIPGGHSVVGKTAGPFVGADGADANVVNGQWQVEAPSTLMLFYKMPSINWSASAHKTNVAAVMEIQVG